MTDETAQPAAPPRLSLAIALGVPALALWLVVLVALANFYFGNTGFGGGGDSGMLSELVNLLAVHAASAALWLLLLALHILAAVRGSAFRFALIADIALIALSLAAGWHAQDLVTPSPQANLALNAPALYPRGPPPYARWPHAPFAFPLLEPALVPPLFLALGFWELVPALRQRAPARLAYGLAWGGVLLLSLMVLAL